MRPLLLLALLALVPAGPALAQKGKGRTEIEKEERDAARRDYAAIRAKFLEPHAAATDPVAGFIAENRIEVANIPEMSALLNEMAQLILAQWRGPKPDIRVVVLANPEPAAFAYGAGLVTLSTGLLQELPSVDAVAAVLAHELAHVLLRHDDRRRDTGRTLSMVTGLASSGVVYGQVARDSGAAKKGAKGAQASVSFTMTPAIRNRLITGYAADAILAETFLPIAKTKQEYEADRLAVDLLVRSPFAADGQADVFRTLQIVEAAAGERVSKAGELIGGLTAELLFGKADGRSDTSNTLIAGGAVLAGTAAKAVFTRVAGKSDGEADANKRRQAYLDYARVYGGEYPLANAGDPQVKAFASRLSAIKGSPGWKSATASIEASARLKQAIRAMREAERARAAGTSQIVAAPPPLPAAATIPTHPQVPASFWARGVASLLEGRPAETLKSLDSGAKLPNFPLDAYRGLAALHFQARQLPRLNAVIEQAERLVGNDLEMLDFKVGAAMLANRAEEAEVLAARCLRDGRAEAYAACSQKLGYDAACAPRTDGGKLAFQEARTTKGVEGALQLQRAAMGKAGGPACG
ncbi:M48 family metalloprotease [Thermaurantiacus sp.]